MGIHKSYQEYIQRKKEKAGVQDQSQSGKQKVKTKYQTQLLGKSVMKWAAQMNFVRLFLGYQFTSFGQSFIKQLSSQGVLKTF